ncbi:MAG TPA: class I SAM-dependent methyltransferase [Candidatus Babeliales bacterium]|nr:class I SAM-dependent methyltransferase [Candidatus Babeliales bacterium]
MNASSDLAAARERAREIIDRCPEWYHSIELAPGVVTPGRAPLDVWNRTLRNLALPDLRGKSVLDIGAYDGFFSFSAERLGAARVVALDEHVWATDMTAYLQEWRGARKTGARLPPPRQSRHWKPAELPGRRPFDAAHGFFESKVEPIVGNFMTIDLETLGKFDVVLFLGVLYHMEDPLPAMRRVASLLRPGGFLGIETEAVEAPGAPDAAFFEFFPTNELNDDAANWFAPNARALEGLVKAVGLRDFQLAVGPPHISVLRRLAARMTRERFCYRAVARAWAPP